MTLLVAQEELAVSDDLLSELRARHQQQAEIAKAATDAMNELAAAIQGILASRSAASSVLPAADLQASSDRRGSGYTPGQSRIRTGKRRGAVANAVNRAVQAGCREVKHIRSHASEHSGLSLSSQSVSNALQRLYEAQLVRQTDEGWMTWEEAKAHTDANFGSTWQQLQGSVALLPESYPRTVATEDNASIASDQRLPPKSDVEGVPAGKDPDVSSPTALQPV